MNDPCKQCARLQARVNDLVKRAAILEANLLTEIRARDETREGRLRECLDTIANELQVWNSGGDHRSSAWPESRIKRIRAALAGKDGAR